MQQPALRAAADEAQQTEAPHVLEPEPRAVGEADAGVHVWQRRPLAWAQDQPAAAHAEVGEEREVAVEPDEQVLRRALHALDGAPAQLAGQRGRDALAQPVSREGDRADRAPAHALVQHATHRFDLGEFGHGPDGRRGPGGAQVACEGICALAATDRPEADIWIDETFTSR
jgi:hypothetical protein